MSKTPTQIKYRGQLYRRAYTPPTPYNRTPQEVAAGLKAMQTAWAQAKAKLAGMKDQPTHLSRLLWQIEQLTYDAHRKLIKEWRPPSAEGYYESDPREHFEMIATVVEQWVEQLDNLKQTLKAFNKAGYLSGK